MGIVSFIQSKKIVKARRIHTAKQNASEKYLAQQLKELNDLSVEVVDGT